MSGNELGVEVNKNCWHPEESPSDDLYFLCKGDEYATFQQWSQGGKIGGLEIVIKTGKKNFCPMRH